MAKLSEAVAGVGENSPRVRDAAAEKLAFLGPTVLVVEAREEIEIAAQVRAALAAG